MGLDRKDLGIVGDPDGDRLVILDENGRFIEIQGTAEGMPFTNEQLQGMINLAQKGIEALMALQLASRVSAEQ